MRIIMQIIKCNKAQFEYDIHALIKAFYPEWELKVLTPESVVRDRKVRETVPVMELWFEEDKVIFKTQSAHEYVWNLTEKLEMGAYKNALKRFLYTSLREETGISLPWGNLTGIRPTKIAMTMMEQGKSDEEIKAFLREEHFFSGEKI